MNKAELLELIKLLSAIQAWGFFAGNNYPEYLNESICQAIDALTLDVLK